MTIEYIFKRQEYVAKAALAGMYYDWFDHTMNCLGPNNTGPHRLYDPDTMELLADWSVNSDKFTDIVEGRANRYGRKVDKARPNNREEGGDTPRGNG